jgi:hypothetical protein
LIEGVEPIRFEGGLATVSGWDGDRFKKAVRRSLARVAFDFLTWVVVGTVVVWLLSSLAVVPVVVDRGDRPGAALTATWDLAVMLHPGAEITEWRSNAGLFSRSFDIPVVLRVGSGTKDLGVAHSRLNLWGLSGGHGSPLVSPIQGDQRTGESLDHLPTGTVVTVELSWPRAVDIADATALMEAHSDVSVIWVGFPTGPGSVVLVPGFGTQGSPAYLGYGTCAMDPPGARFGWGGSSMGSDGSLTPIVAPSITRALDQVQRAMDNLVSRNEIVDALGRFGGASPADIEQARTYLAKADPGVVSMVVTGPTDLVRQFVSDAAAPVVTVQGVDFWNWTGPVCGGQ